MAPSKAAGWRSSAFYHVPHGAAMDTIPFLNMDSFAFVAFFYIFTPLINIKYIMKKIILSLLLAFSAAGAFAQDEAEAADTDSAQSNNNSKSAFYSTPYRQRNSGSYGKNFFQLSVSYGFPNHLYWNGYYGSGFYGNGIGLGPLMLRAEKAVHDEIGVMVFGQVATKTWKNGGYKENAFGVAFGAMGVYHFNKLIPVRKLDVYAAVGAEVDHHTLSDNYYAYDYSGTDFDFCGVVGARYLFSKSFSVFAEGGTTGYSYTNAGITFTIATKHTRKSDEAPKVGPGE